MDAKLINEVQVEKVKTAQGMTKFLVDNDKKEGPQIMIRYWGENTDLPIHAHKANELFYILSGEVEIAGEIHGPGTCIFVPKASPTAPCAYLTAKRPSCVTTKPKTPSGGQPGFAHISASWRHDTGWHAFPRMADGRFCLSCASLRAAPHGRNKERGSF